MAKCGSDCVVFVKLHKPLILKVKFSWMAISFHQDLQPLGKITSHKEGCGIIEILSVILSQACSVG